MLSRVVFLGAGLLVASAAQAEVSLSTVKPFLKKHCFACHGAQKQKGHLRYDTLGANLSDFKTIEIWQKILDQLNLGEMPPEKKPQPTLAETTPVIDLLTSRLKMAYAKQRSTGRQAVIRRMNKFELRNTLRDLLYLEHPDFHPTVVSGLYDFNNNGNTAHKTIEPTRSFPDDEEEHGFDNIGNRLVMSDFLLNMMLGAAEESIKMATHNEEEPKFVSKKYTAPICKGNVSGHSIERWQRDLNQGYDEVFQRYDRYGRVGPDELRKGIRKPGQYRITVELSGHNQKHPWGAILKTNQEEPFYIGLYLERMEHLRGPRIEQLVQWDLPGDGKKRTFSFETWIDKTWMPWVGWENGPHIKHNVHGNIVKKYYPDYYSRDKKGKRDPWSKAMANILFEKGYKGPSVRVYRMTIEPLRKDWPPKSHTALYGKGPIEQADRKRLLMKFAERAYRRPVAASEVDAYVALVKKVQDQGADLQQAMQTAYVAILCSPKFIYIKQKSGRLDNYETASRLSYFLWSSMPDDRLMKLAKEGKLTQPSIVGSQIERMLNDPKAAAFPRHFTERWLQLHELGKMPPDKKGPFGIYFRLKEGMISQVDAFFTDLLQNNGNIRHFIDSDYTFMNGTFAQHYYKQEGVIGNYFRKVPLKDKRQGGLFTMPAIMTVTANGVDTSPIVRGVYVLENILGTPPSPPPPDVDPLSPDLRNAKTLKEQLALHRKNESCNACHRKIDPMGFAMESFDPIGRIRTHYPKPDKRSKKPAVVVDTTSTTADGIEIKNIIDFKQMLLQREELVVRCLTTKMLTYATGRMMEPGDRGEIDRIVGALKRKGNGLRDLVKLIAQSDLFLNK